MENNNYLNKSLENARKLIENVGPQMDAINKIIPILKEEIKRVNPNSSNELDKLEKLAKNADIKQILELKNNLYANKGKY